MFTKSCTSTNRWYFKNVTALFPSLEHWVKWLFVGFWKDGLLAKLLTKRSRGCIFSLFLPHKYQVSLIYMYYLYLEPCDLDPCPLLLIVINTGNGSIKHFVPFGPLHLIFDLDLHGLLRCDGSACVCLKAGSFHAGWHETAQRQTDGLTRSGIWMQFHCRKKVKITCLFSNIVHLLVCQLLKLDLFSAYIPCSLHYPKHWKNLQ